LIARLQRCVLALVPLFLALGTAALLLAGLGDTTPNAVAQAVQPDPIPFTAEYYASPHLRFGVGLSRGTSVNAGGSVRPARITDYAVDSLGAGWYSDWSYQLLPLRPGGIRYAQLIPVKAREYPTNTLQLTETVRANPGSLWIVGNEPEALYNQGNRTPQEYAEIYHDVHAIVKGNDESAWVAIGGVIEPTALRLKWLDRVLSEYESRYGVSMPVDVWNTHVQILPEKAGSWGAEIPVGLTETQGSLFDFSDDNFSANANPVFFRQLITQFRQWMKDRGFENKPLMVSEYGVLFPSDYAAGGGRVIGDQGVIDFMHATFSFMLEARDPELGYAADDDRLVQQWLWYSLNDQPFDDATGRGFNGALFSHLDPTRITPFGIAFRQYIWDLMGYPKAFLPAVTRNISRGR